MLNRCEFIGNLGNDPEVRNTNSGSKIVGLSIGVTEKWKDRNSGEQKEKTEWVRCQIFNEGLAGVAEKYLKKGSKVYISGSMQTRKWQDQSGQDRYSTEIILSGFDAKLVLLDGPAVNRNELNRPAPKPAAADPFDGLSDDIPF